MWDQHPTWTYDWVINQAVKTIDPLASLQGKVATGGRLNLAKALTATVDPPAPPALIELHGPDNVHS